MIKGTTLFWLLPKLVLPILPVKYCCEISFLIRRRGKGKPRFSET